MFGRCISLVKGFLVSWWWTPQLTAPHQRYIFLRYIVGTLLRELVPTGFLVSSSSFVTNAMNFVLSSLMTMPHFSHQQASKFSFSMRRCRLVAKSTVSSISINRCNHSKNPSKPERPFTSWMNSSTNSMNKEHEVGEPCLTPTTDVMTVAPKTN